MSGKYYPGWAQGLDIDWASDADCGIVIRECKQCGGTIPRRGLFSDFCKRACERAWNRENHNQLQEAEAKERRKARAKK